MRLSDISAEQIRKAASLTVDAEIQLRDEGGEDSLKWHDEDFRNLVSDSLFHGRYWRRVARIHTVEDARREMTFVAAQIEGRRALDRARRLRFAGQKGA